MNFLIFSHLLFVTHLSLVPHFYLGINNARLSAYVSVWSGYKIRKGSPVPSGLEGQVKSGRVSNTSKQSKHKSESPLPLF